jgi:hypothetical protein
MAEDSLRGDEEGRRPAHDGEEQAAVHSSSGSKMGEGRRAGEGQLRSGMLQGVGSHL